MAATAKHIAIEFAHLAWRLILYVAILIAAFRLLSIGYGAATHALRIHFAAGPGVKSAEAVGFGQARLLIAAIIAWAVTARLGRDRIGSILPFRAAAASHVVQGTLWGFGGIAATIGAIALLGGYQISGVALSGTALFYYGPLWLVIALVNGVAENMAVMGYPLFRVARSTGWPPAVLLVALLFAAAHLGNPGENPWGIAGVFVMSLVMAGAIWLTGDLWLSVGLHAGIIIAEDMVFSVPDSGVSYTGHLLTSRLSGPVWLSGGDAGPEGSVLALPIFALLLVVLWLVYRRKPQAGLGTVEVTAREKPLREPA